MSDSDELTVQMNISVYSQKHFSSLGWASTKICRCTETAQTNGALGAGKEVRGQSVIESYLGWVLNNNGILHVYGKVSPTHSYFHRKSPPIFVFCFSWADGDRLPTVILVLILPLLQGNILRVGRRKLTTTVTWLGSPQPWGCFAGHRLRTQLLRSLGPFWLTEVSARWNFWSVYL